MTITLRLPFPPTANHYNQQRVGMACGKPRVFFYRTKRAKMFYATVADLVRDRFDDPPLLTDRLFIRIELVSPNRKRWDVSNYAKCIEDSLQEAGLFVNDSQVDEIQIVRKHVDPAKVGWADVTIETTGDP